MLVVIPLLALALSTVVSASSAPGTFKLVGRHSAGQRQAYKSKDLQASILSRY